MSKYNSTYTGDRLRHIAFPLGGIGAGMICLQGSGILGNFSIRNSPDIHCEPDMFSAICIKNKAGNIARVLEGQVPFHKIFGGSGMGLAGMGNGLHGKNYGLPRFKSNDFTAQFPFAKIKLYDDTIPLDISITGWSPFIPLDADNSSLPAAALEFNFTNTTDKVIDAIYSYNSLNFLTVDKRNITTPSVNDASVFKYHNGFILHQPEKQDNQDVEIWFCAAVNEDAYVNTKWYDGGWFDKRTMVWNDVEAGIVKNAHQIDNKSPGGSITVPFSLKPKESKKIILKFAWYSPKTSLRRGMEADCEPGCECKSQRDGYKPWYSMRFNTVENVMGHFTEKYATLCSKSREFSLKLFSEEFPAEIIEAVSANLSILKSPTILRQTDGRLWCWEGCCDSEGCCNGSCTHVWNYAQAICHLFPSLERSLRETEFYESQNESGHQAFRSALPIRTAGHDFHAASDGQLGGIMKMHREWKISGDRNWMAGYWDKIKASLNYCIDTWDKKREGVLKEPHHNTYDIEFWGADGMCSLFYLGALKAACVMGEELGHDITEYRILLDKGKEYLETKLFNGEYFYQKTEWETLEANLDTLGENDQCRELIETEGPKYQYGTGCISDGVIGAWMARVCGLGDIIDPEKIKSHLLSTYKYNFRKSLINHVNPQRPGYAIGNEGGLLLCTWPKGDKPSLPFPYSDEVWSGIEYQVASHLMMFGEKEKGLEIVQTVRSRYDGTNRNPFDEYECGHWYARALSSYSLLEGMSGIRYDAVDKTLFIKKDLPDGYRSFICTATGYGVVSVSNDVVEVELASGQIEITKIIKM
ncbi:MAG: hypothetical protein KAH14_09010 [Clostridiales bacterium]|nr:hypothetical protein [Clostridiales bacterium]